MDELRAISPIILFFTDQGVPIGTVFLLLAVPLVVTLISFFRQVVGIQSFGLYTPTMITFAFVAIGIKYGLAIYITVIAVGMIMRTILKHFRLLYLPRVAITMTIVSISVLMILVAGGYYQRTGLAAASVFPILIIITLVEKFIATQSEKGSRAALFLATETLFVSLVGFYVVSLDQVVEYLIVAPWLVLLTIPLNLALGKWTGLRLTEYIRFRELLKR